MFEDTPISGIRIYTPTVHVDNRGFFMETYRHDQFAKNGIPEVFVQDNHAESIVRNTVRGLNLASAPTAKIMRVLRGSAFIVAVDMRPDSATFGQWYGVEASDENKKQIYTPAGFARGYQTLTDICDMHYKCSAYHEGDEVIMWNDPSIGIDWPIKDSPILSERSKNGMSLEVWSTHVSRNQKLA